MSSYLRNGLGTISTIHFSLNDLFDLVPPVNITTGSNQCYRTLDFRGLCVFDLAPPVNNSRQQVLTSSIAHLTSGDITVNTHQTHNT